ncbi:DUF3889 domain-containing protein [Bacillus sp. DTU_2020_1000418_1_SI_GHA_SEK_038]|uniref:DUF3889 domain-containing protein n=1 Tax=Bacillus sp. DTU_2020_1000418_1_SI_GHA_SEK_038 TaxID=3077585 RepID=UPI0028E9DF6A|nr:DUF3889 domain-containing protein [Bacillus sp. DTU_2020_1000418_1_SI_GHA_SEK_038]WNS76712.1 DUF3889 domain-containing protein [Bacillus sp. DTU_2020_1000418_1_SI_GHA_SEK_038]
MKKLFCMMFTVSLFLNAHNLAFAQNDYEKYGRIATAVVKEDYPGEEVVDYQYAGRKKLSETDVMDSFIFEVKENNQLKKVTVNISHSLKNNRLLQLTVDEQKG